MPYANKKQRTEYHNNYNAKRYDSIRVVVPKGKKKDYMTLADKLGLKLNTLVNQLLEQKMTEVEENGNI